MSYAWATDIHLDHVVRFPNRFKDFADSIAPYKGLIISGDIANADSVILLLDKLYFTINKPIYFVLGNHDYYGSDIRFNRIMVDSLNCDIDTCGNIVYLTTFEPFLLEPGVAICGVDGWADARAGDFKNSPIKLNDSVYISELRIAATLDVEYGTKCKLEKEMKRLSRKDNIILKKQLDSIHYGLGDIKEIIIVTHVPPFAECCLYNNRPSNKDFLPFFCNKSMGNLLVKEAKKYPEIKYTVLCGHTHGKCDPYDRLPNLRVRIGGAEYGHPELAGEIL